jgi:hypothetical protein
MTIEGGILRGMIVNRNSSPSSNGDYNRTHLSERFEEILFLISNQFCCAMLDLSNFGLDFGMHTDDVQAR